MKAIVTRSDELEKITPHTEYGLEGSTIGELIRHIDAQHGPYAWFARDIEATAIRGTVLPQWAASNVQQPIGTGSAALAEIAGLLQYINGVIAAVTMSDRGQRPPALSPLDSSPTELWPSVVVEVHLVDNAWVTLYTSDNDLCATIERYFDEHNVGFKRL